MDKDIKDYLPHYLGCKVAIAEENYKGDSLLLLGICDMGCQVTDDGIKLTFYINTEHVKPILRPLSDMSEDEIIDLAKISDCLPTKWFEYGSFIVQKLEHPNTGIEVCVNRKYSFRITQKGGIYFHDYSKPNLAIYAPRTPLVIIAMLKMGFDLFGLIAAGLAIDKTKLPSPPKTK